MADAVTGQVIGVCMKWVALRPDVDAVAATVMSDDRFAGASASDRAALEWALRLAERRGATVTVVSVGPAGAEQLLREALACGAHRGVRVDSGLPADRQPTSRAVPLHWRKYCAVRRWCCAAIGAWIASWVSDRHADWWPLMTMRRSSSTPNVDWTVATGNVCVSMVRRYCQ